jgi:AcrR family transcriptional regulator
MEETKKKRSRGRPKQVDKVHSIEIAMLDYWENGIHTRSINEVCKHIEMSKPAFYREFENEDGLMQATLKRYRELRIVPLLEILEADLPFNEVLKKAVEFLTENRETPKGCLFTKMRVLRTELGPNTSQEVQNMENEFHVALKDLHKRATTKGEVNTDIPQDAAALYMGSQFTLALVQSALEIPTEIIRAQVSLALGVVGSNKS